MNTNARHSVLSEHPVIVLVGFLAAIITIIVFVFGGNLPDLLGRGAGNRYVGQWKDSKGATWEFFKNGSLQITEDFYGDAVVTSGTYSVVDNSHIHVELGGLAALGGPQVFETRIIESQLTLKSGDYSFYLTKVR